MSYASDGSLMSDSDMQAYNVTGMSCAHCVSTVQMKVGELQGVDSVDVDLASGRVVVRGSGVDDEAVRIAVEAAGYGLVAPA